MIKFSLITLWVLTCTMYAKADGIVLWVIDTGITVIDNNFKKYIDPQSDDLRDTNGHGTQMTSLIIYGPNSNEVIKTSQLKIKSCNAYKANPILDTIDCLRKVLRDARANKNTKYVINYSSSGFGFDKSNEEYKLLNQLLLENVIIFAAAGNTGKHIDNRSDCNIFWACYKLFIDEKITDNFNVVEGISIKNKEKKISTTFSIFKTKKNLTCGKAYTNDKSAVKICGSSIATALETRKFLTENLSDLKVIRKIDLFIEKIESFFKFIEF